MGEPVEGGKVKGFQIRAVEGRLELISHVRRRDFLWEFGKFFLGSVRMAKGGAPGELAEFAVVVAGFELLLHFGCRSQVENFIR